MVFYQVCLNVVDDSLGLGNVGVFVCYDQAGLSGGYPHAQRFAQKTKVAVGRSEQIELLVGLI